MLQIPLASFFSISPLPNPLASKMLPWELGVARRSFVTSFSVPFVLSTAAFNAASEAIDAYWATWREVYAPRGNPRAV